MARTAQSKKQIAKKKAAIVEAAAEVFTLRGIAATSMDHVATKLGWSKGTIYNYIPTRDDLIAAVFDWLVEAQASALQQAPLQATESASGDLARYLEGILAMRAQMKQMFSLAMNLWAAAIAEPNKSLLKDQFEQIYQFNIYHLGAILNRGQKSGEFRNDFDPMKMASLLVGAWDGLLFQAWLDHEFDIDTPARQHLQALLRGLVANPKTTDKQE